MQKWASWSQKKGGMKLSLNKQKKIIFKQHQEAVT